MTRRLPSRWTIRLNYPRPLPGLHANDRVDRREKARNTAIIREQVMYLVRAAHVPACERIRVDVAWFVPDNRVRDTDNLAPWLKAIYDGIGSSRGVSARIVDDDSPSLMDKPAATIHVVKGVTAHFAVSIVDLGSAD